MGRENKVAVLRIRRLEKVDLPVRVAWFNSQDAYRQMPLDVPFSLAETGAWFSRTLLDSSRLDFAAAVEHDSGEELVAMFGLVDIDPKNRKAELYIIVNPTMRAQGIGSACIRWLCNYGFGHVGLNKIYLFTLFQNELAQRFYERLGFRQEGVLREHLFYRGTMMDRCIYAMLAKEWLQSSQSNLDSLDLRIRVKE